MPHNLSGSLQGDKVSCPYCGALMNADGRICGSCGRDLVTSNKVLDIPETGHPQIAPKSVAPTTYSAPAPVIRPVQTAQNPTVPTPNPATTSILGVIGTVILWLLASGAASMIGGVVGAMIFRLDAILGVPAFWITYFAGFWVYRKNKRVLIGLGVTLLLGCLLSVIAVYLFPQL